MNSCMVGTRGVCCFYRPGPPTFYVFRMCQFLNDSVKELSIWVPGGPRLRLMLGIHRTQYAFLYGMHQGCVLFLQPGPPYILGIQNV